jgi:hypothetical protein
MTSTSSKLALAGALSFAAALCVTGSAARADQFKFSGNNHQVMVHTANIGNGHTETTIQNRETHMETHEHFDKNGNHWFTAGKIGGDQKFVFGHTAMGRPLTGKP